MQTAVFAKRLVLLNAALIKLKRLGSKMFLGDRYQLKLASSKPKLTY